MTKNLGRFIELAAVTHWSEWMRPDWVAGEYHDPTLRVTEYTLAIGAGPVEVGVTYFRRDLLARRSWRQRLTL